ncbi:MAG: hypothetical protein H6699_12080, partial [Myxococcales bacterium]|nr:hypothetical protein [Myxococcales bacterium]
YSYTLLAGGGAVKDIQDVGQRDQILQGVVPHMRTRYAESDASAVEMRDAAYNLRQATTTPAVIAEFDGILADWLLNKWDPCRVGTGVVRIVDLFEVLGATVGSPKIVEVVREGAFDRVLCFGRDVTDLSWMKTSNEIAQAYIDRWTAGNVDQNTQLKFEYLEQALRLSAAPAMRAWIFDQLNNPDTDPLFKNAMLDAVSTTRTDADADGYRRLLTNETNARWAAFQALVDGGGSEGLELALSSLPPTGEYGFYRDAVRPDGLKSVTSSFLCTLTKLTELGDNARVVFERHIGDENVPARVISIACLGFYGDRGTVGRLQDAKSALGRTPVPAPGFGEGASVQDVIDATISAIETRLAAPH